MSDSLVFLISGCSAGFGAELCLAALKRGHKVVATARNPDASGNEYITQIKEAGGVCTKLDVTVPASCDAAVAFAKEKYGAVDVVINNAGFGIVGSFEDTPDTEVRALMDTNFFGALNLARSAIPVMRESKRPKRTIVNISSIAGFQSSPGSAMYSASKYAMEGWSEGLHNELSPFGIRVFTVEPGAFRTRFLQSNSFKQMPVSEPYQGSHPVAALDNIIGHFKEKGMPGNPTVAAQRMLEEIEDPTMITVPTWDGKQVERPVSRFALGDDAVPAYEMAVALFSKNIEATKHRGSGTNFE